MTRFHSRVLESLINVISRNKASLLGGIIVIVLFPVLFVSILFDMQGVVQNPYFGFLIYLVMGPLFVLGLVLLLVGSFFAGNNDDMGLLTVEYFKEQLNRPGRFSRIRKLVFVTALLTFITLFVVGVVTYTGFNYTESVSFCGKFCHQVMEPEYVTYTNSPHSRVPCVKCHISSDSRWFTKSKFSGVKQLFAVMFHTYSRPIKTPITALRPERRTCEGCHRPEEFPGDILKVEDKFLPDEKNTHVQTVMLLRIGTGDYRGRKAQGIHWHVSKNYKVLYKSSPDHKRISEVTLIGPDKKKIVFRNTDYAGRVAEPGPYKERVMDCMDCHNRPTHVFLSPNEALDRKMATGIIPDNLPYIKRQALAAITKKYASADTARFGIAKDILGWYRKNYPDIVRTKRALLDKAVRGAQQAYMENVFPQMNIGWGTYQSFIGHKNGSGCFRCHSGKFKTATGKTIPNNCDLCHLILAENKPAMDIFRILKSSIR